MKKIITILLFVFILSFVSFAQDEDKKEKKNCPDVDITITGPPSITIPGETQAFTLEITGDYDEDKLKIEWSAENATIVRGQGTKTLLIMDTENKGGFVVTAKVDLGNGCILTASETAIFIDPPDSRLVDEFGDIQSGDMKARLDAYFVELQNNSNAQGYIINYGSKRDIAKRERFIRNYTKLRNFELDRLVFVNGGKEDKIRTRIWLVPAGADASTID